MFAPGKLQTLQTCLLLENHFVNIIRGACFLSILEAIILKFLWFPCVLMCSVFDEKHLSMSFLMTLWHVLVNLRGSNSYSCVFVFRILDEKHFSKAISVDGLFSIWGWGPILFRQLQTACTLLALVILSCLCWFEGLSYRLFAGECLFTSANMVRALVGLRIIHK